MLLCVYLYYLIFFLVFFVTCIPYPGVAHQIFWCCCAMTIKAFYSILYHLLTSAISTADSISCILAVSSLLNVRSLANKSFICQDFIMTNNIDILFITETWLSPGSSFLPTEACPPNYSCFNQPRLSGCGGGGAIINNNFKCSPVYFISFTSSESLNSLLHTQHPSLCFNL